jgi:hypothetical protein
MNPRSGLRRWAWSAQSFERARFGYRKLYEKPMTHYDAVDASGANPRCATRSGRSAKRCTFTERSS